MIFYTAENEAGDIQIVGTQAEAREINKQFDQIDIPTDKAGLLSWVNQMQAEFNALRKQIENQIDTSGVDLPEASETSQSTCHHYAPVDLGPVVDVEAETSTPIMEMGPAELAPILNDAVERAGELGERAFDAIDTYQTQFGVGGSFSRGVHVLSVICTNEHQLSRVLFRTRKEKKS